MTATTVVVLVLWCAVTAYAVLGGADFGAGIWDLTAGGPEKGAARRDLIDRSIGPIGFLRPSRLSAFSISVCQKEKRFRKSNQVPCSPMS